MNITTKKQFKFYIFYCSNSLDVNELSGSIQEEDGIEYRIISLPCSGKADILYLIKAFETGADGLLLITCEKNQCHYLEGNLRSPKRAEEVNLLLEEIGMGRERIAVVSIDKEGISPVLARINEFKDSIKCIASRQS